MPYTRYSCLLQLLFVIIFKKVVWRWNESDKLFEYIYAVVGLSDMVERWSINVGVTHIPDIYCTLCAEVLPHSQEWLDSHIRSLSHIVNYVVGFKRSSFPLLIKFSIIR